jgi:hypothetical protein
MACMAIEAFFVIFTFELTVRRRDGCFFDGEITTATLWVEVSSTPLLHGKKKETYLW